ncbi:MAG: hypothetical protein ACRYFA_11115 [Janthinobacterium lividum]
MKIISYLLLGTVFASGQQTFAQSKSNLKSIKKVPQAVLVDGNLKDWGDSLSYYNEAKRINYGLAQDQENLYFAIRIENRGQQEQAMRNGITLNFNPEGKKKNTFSLTFPSPDRDENSLFTMPKTNDAVTEQQLKQEDIEAHRKADLLKLRDIQVTGFKDVETEHITTDNTYGIKTVLNFDKKGALVYEAAIPVKMLHVDNANGKPWLFDIKINSFATSKDGHDGLKPPGAAGGIASLNGGGGMRGGGGMGGGGGMSRGGMGNMDGSSGQAKAVEIKDKFVW